MLTEKGKDLFGDPIITGTALRDDYIEPPFSVLDTRSGRWINRRNRWRNLGIKSELGREDGLTYSGAAAAINHYYVKNGTASDLLEIGTSIFDPVLTEIMYHWFCPKGGSILDPFAGGSVRGIVAAELGYKYTGIELREEQVESNEQQAREIFKDRPAPKWLTGDSDKVLPEIRDKFDFVFSCPPYMDLEVYSNKPDDLSNMSDAAFIEKYNSIIIQSCIKLKSGGMACFVIGDVRDKKTGYYKDFITITKNAFKMGGLHLYNEIILLNQVASASMRAHRQMSAGKKVAKIHQNIYVFIKP